MTTNENTTYEISRDAAIVVLESNVKLRPYQKIKKTDNK